jgi:hypothetical protein
MKVFLIIDDAQGLLPAEKPQLWAALKFLTDC